MPTAFRLGPYRFFFYSGDGDETCTCPRRAERKGREILGEAGKVER
nr:MAG: hypothetical protein BECKTC1821F_GA0114240_101525 [Candidatus Kentron sp. TC]